MHRHTHSPTEVLCRCGVASLGAVAAALVAAFLWAPRRLAGMSGFGDKGALDDAVRTAFILGDGAGERPGCGSAVRVIDVDAAGHRA